MWADFPKYKHLKQAIYRGPGGAGDATGDATNAAALALSKANEASASATSAASSATAAAASASAADSDASDAATSASNAAGSASSASTSATNAASSATDAETAQIAAEDAQEAAETAESGASTSASAASTSASAAATSATNAASSASAASTSASNAASSATAAASSATAAAASAVTAATFDPALFLSKADNLNSVASKSTARTNLGLTIGTDVLAPNGSAASLTSFPTLNQNTTGTSGGLTGTPNISVGTLQFNSGYGSSATAYGCRAWVNFNGTGTVTIRASGNVSSITDNGSGDYTVNFTTAMPDANYAVVCNSVLASTTSSTGSAGPYGTFAAGASTKTTSAIRTLFGNSSTGNATDTAEANVAIFR